MKMKMKFDEMFEHYMEANNKNVVKESNPDALDDQVARAVHRDPEYYNLIRTLTSHYKLLNKTKKDSDKAKIESAIGEIYKKLKAIENQYAEKISNGKLGSNII
jgi:hypothetical protein